MNKDEIHTLVRDNYAALSRKGGSCCGVAQYATSSEALTTISQAVGYSSQELESVPEGANLGLGCGNPLALALLKEGQTVVDLGSGGGLDCFLAARQVGERGRVIGIDMTPEMVDRGRRNAAKGNYPKVEFRLGEIEHLPVANETADVLLSNCVINLSPDKRRVFREAYRVLRPGGTLMVSDIVLLDELPGFITDSDDAYCACIAGAAQKQDYLESIRDAGFTGVFVQDETSVAGELVANDPALKEWMEKAAISQEALEELANSVKSVRVSAVRPGRA